MDRLMGSSEMNSWLEKFLQICWMLKCRFRTGGINTISLDNIVRWIISFQLLKRLNQKWKY